MLPQRTVGSPQRWALCLAPASVRHVRGLQQTMTHSMLLSGLLQRHCRPSSAFRQDPQLPSLPSGSPGKCSERDPVLGVVLEALYTTGGLTGSGAQSPRAEAKDILFDNDSRRRMQDGINKLADAVGSTLGPRGASDCTLHLHLHFPAL